MSHHILEDINSTLPSSLSDLADEELDTLLDRWLEIGNVLQQEQCRRRLEKRYSKPLLHDKVSDDKDGLPSEVLRQLLPFLTATEIGRLFLFCNKSLLSRVGSETIWKTLCLRLFRASHDASETNGNREISEDKLERKIVATLGSYETFFRQRHKPILLAQEHLVPLPPPSSMASPESATNPLILVVDLWRKHPQQQLLISEPIDNLTELLEHGTTTVPISTPMPVAKLSRQKAHAWHIPPLFQTSHDAAQVRVQLFRLDQGLQLLSTTTNHAAPVLLNTEFCLWRGWANHGEMTFVQRERTVGLQLTDRGQWIQHRIVQCRHPRWMNYLGLQFKVVLLCEPMVSSSQDHDDQFVVYGFTKIRIEAIRLHENTHGNIQHHLFRKDDGWQKHGVTLPHLIEELC